MAWLRYASMLMPTILQALTVAESLSDDKQFRRRFMKTWASRLNDLGIAALNELTDQIEDETEDTAHIEQGVQVAQSFDIDLNLPIREKGA